MKTCGSWKLCLAVIGLAALLIAAPGCKRHRGEIDIDPDAGTGGPSSGMGSGMGDEITTGTGLPSIDPEKLAEIEKLKEMKIVYFDFDSYSLRPDALAALDYNADLLKQPPLNDAYILIEGHCDERGTQKYNIALGERRALAVRDHLIRLGVSGDRLLTVTYGEEDPADPGHNEAAWAKNRRCEFSRADKP